mgnify:FL=1
MDILANILKSAIKEAKPKKAPKAKKPAPNRDGFLEDYSDIVSNDKEIVFFSVKQTCECCGSVSSYHIMHPMVRSEKNTGLSNYSHFISESQIRELPRRVEWTEENIPYCAECFESASLAPVMGRVNETELFKTDGEK